MACAVFTAWATLTSVRLPALDRVILDLGAFNYPWHPYLIGILNHAILFVVGLTVSALFRKGGEQSGATPAGN